MNRFWSQDRKCVESDATAVLPSPHRAAVAGGEGGVGDRDRHGPHSVGGQVAAPRVADVFLAVPVRRPEITDRIPQLVP